jgi:acetate kinase
MGDGRFLRILTINSGSSSLKVAMYHMGRSETLMLSGSIERIGLRASLFHIQDADGETLIQEHLDLPDHDAALKTLFEWLQGHAPGQDLEAVGHRVVHGGAQYNQPHLITPELVATLRELVPLAPDHLPHELKAIEAVSRSYPALKQVACFDTAFHRHMPQIAQIYALPRHFRHEGVLRYGFHGLSYEYIMQELRREAGPEVASGRVVIAHLGNGASMAAVLGGKSVDTTMGLTPTGGLVMSTRSGDLDPGVILYLLEEKGMRPSTLNDLLNQHAGLLGVSGTTSDMRDLLSQEAKNLHAAAAVDLFCYQAKKYLGALAAVLGGLDTLIFTGGIGENAAPVRWRICQDMEFLGIRLDPGRNDANAPIISRSDSPASVRVMRTDEELMIARHTYTLASRQ